jgi:hypothetical protein
MNYWPKHRKLTKKKLLPFLVERNLELLEFTNSSTHYYFLSVIGAGYFQSRYHDKNHFYKLTDVFNFLMENHSFNYRNLI